MRTFAVIIGLMLALAVSGCDAEQEGHTVEESDSVRYVALGDSYTIGTSVGLDDRWPNVLVERIEELELVGNPAVNGYTSVDLIDHELPLLDRLQPEFVTLLIGVNDVVQGVPVAQYSSNLAVILEELLARLPPDRVLCVATPDYTVTPQGSTYGDPAQQSGAIRRFNEIMREACESRGIAFAGEIFEISQGVPDDPSLVADDGLHPSGSQYSLWADAIAPLVSELLRSPPR